MRARADLLGKAAGCAPCDDRAFPFVAHPLRLSWQRGLQHSLAHEALPTPQDGDPITPLGITRWRDARYPASSAPWANSSAANGAKSGTHVTTRATSSATTPSTASGCLRTAPRAFPPNQGAITC